MSRFLEQVHLERYGAFADRELGPFGRGLNVVFGPNEAGKSTIASLIGSVLFGWEEAHGVRNTYSPATGERAGTLSFSGGATLRRSDSGDGLEGETSIVADVDSATYHTMFSLTSDELRSLRNSSDVTARLLTAGSGTGSSPAGAFVEIEQRIAALTARRSPADRHELFDSSGELRLEASRSSCASIYELSDALDEKRELVKAIGNAVRTHKLEDAELNKLYEDRSVAARRVETLNGELDALIAGKARIESLDAQIAARRAEISDIDAERDRLEPRDNGDSPIDPRLLALSPADERSLRDRLDEYADEQAKAVRGVDIAKENAAASAAAYEALMEMDDDQSAGSRARVAKTSQTIVPALLAIVFALAGIPVFAHGRTINSLSLTALGIGLVVFAALVGIAAVAIALRPDKGADALAERRKDAQWVMLQDRKRLDASVTAKELVDSDVATLLEQAGLAEAKGSIRQARLMLDDAREARSQAEALRQREAALTMRTETAQVALDELEQERASIATDLGFDGDGPLGPIEKAIALKTEQRDAFVQAGEDVNARIGELRERLDIARADRSYDREKLAYQQIQVRLREATHELATLLLAKRMLEKSIVAWESRSQPEVYRKASELLFDMTGGTWKRISMTAEGQLIVTSPGGIAREVRHLSLGTCQQLYLSLRIAMLLHAEDVGRSVPVLADDILVNFDAARRDGAARALAKLAEKRQVIVFTCHRETIEALRCVQPGLNYLEL